MLPMNID